MLPFLTFKTNVKEISYSIHPLSLHKKFSRSWLFLAFLCLFFFGFCLEDTPYLLAASNLSKEETTVNSSAITVSGHDLSVSFLYGFDKSSKYGKQMNLSAKITNHGDNFSGTIGILCIPNNDSGETLYEVPCVIAAGETKKIELTAPISSSNWPSLLIKDEKEQVIIQEYFRVTMTTDPSVVFLGVLSDNTEDFSYISSTGLAKLFLLDETVLPSTKEGLDSLDILMISDFNTERLSKEQINAILQWVRQGGMLVFGTGSTANKTLSAFQESVFNGSIGKVEKRTTLLNMSEEEFLSLKSELSVSINQPLDYDETTYLDDSMDNTETSELTKIDTNMEPSEESVFTDRISQKEIDSLTLKAMPKDMVSLKFENFFPILSEKDGFDLIIKNNYGNGTILAAAFELSMEATYRNSMGTQLYHIIENNFSQTKQFELSGTDPYNGFYSLSRALNVNEQTTYPHLKLYFFILIAYAIITGPILYFILKKLDKRHLLWAMMPSFCILCTIIVYITGNSTRITEPFIHYLSFLTIDQSEESKQTDFVQDVYFNVTAPYNKKYSIPLTNVSNVEVRSNNFYSMSYSYDMNRPESSSYYKTAIYKDGSENTSLIMNDYAAFHTANFHCNSSEVGIHISGNLETDLTLNEDFTITGTLTNHLGIDLYQAIYISNGQLYILGSMKNGDSVSLEDCEFSIFNTPQNIENSFTSSNTETMQSISGCMGWDNDATPLERQLYFAYVYYLESNSSLLTEGGRFIAVTENAVINFLENTGLSTKGLQFLDIHTAPVNTTMEILDSSFVSVLEGSADLLTYRYLDEMATISYHITDPKTVLSLTYQQSGNAEFYDFASPDFNGTVLAYNILTGEYDELFQSGTPKTCDNLSPYLSRDGRLILRYQRNPAMAYSENTIPLLYLIREE